MSRTHSESAFDFKDVLCLTKLKNKKKKRKYLRGIN